MDRPVSSRFPAVTLVAATTLVLLASTIPHGSQRSVTAAEESATDKAVHAGAQSQSLNLTLRHRTETVAGSGRYHTLTKTEAWNPAETALIICDVWDRHHCLNAVRRVNEFAPRLIDVVNRSRELGLTIIHAPSDCMPAYEQHPARLRAISAPKAAKYPADIGVWCSRIPAEERGVYPVDQSDGGEDDDPIEHAEWAAQLAAEGRNPKLPWKAQIAAIPIDGDRDYITDRGEEVWNILESRGVKNVILAGVHTNMCVLGRPFGLRQMVRAGKRTTLLRDLTDTMYNPQRWPHVSHFSGTDLVIEHIEKFVCPTITSDQIVGGSPFRFSQDHRPQVVFLVAEDEYETETTLPRFAAENLQRNCRVTFVYASESNKNELLGLEAIDTADVIVVSVRRRPLLPAQIAKLKAYAAAGKPVVGIRTASHAFSVRAGQPAPAGCDQWPEFDREIFGGNYTGHHANESLPMISAVETATAHPLLSGRSISPFKSGGSLYHPSPLAPGTTVLWTGRIEGKPAEPVAWTFTRRDSGRSFYTSLGSKGDFTSPSFVDLLTAAIHWGAGRDARSTAGLTSLTSTGDRYRSDWGAVPVPANWSNATNGRVTGSGVGWYRCGVRIPSAWQGQTVSLSLGASQGNSLQAFWNGEELKSGQSTYAIPTAAVSPGELHLLAVRVENTADDGGLNGESPFIAAENDRIPLAGTWQFRSGENPEWAGLPLPAKFAVATDVVFDRVVAIAADGAQVRAPGKAPANDITARAKQFIADHEALVKPLEIALAREWWTANTTGSQAAYTAKEEAQNKLDGALSDRVRFRELKAIHDAGLKDALLARQVHVLYLMYLEKQVDPALLKQIAAKGNAIEKAFNVFRAEVDGQPISDSEVRRTLKESDNSARRKAVWEASKKVGSVVEADLKALVQLRNEAARGLGFNDFHAMMLSLNEQSQDDVIALFDELDTLTREPFMQAKAEIDAELAANCKVRVADLQAWHYQDPFFQEAPALGGYKLDDDYKTVDVLKVCREYYDGIGLPISDVIERSDLFERDGKSPHAFCTDIDREGDVRVLANIVPTEYWMSTMLHELGHAVYSSKNIPRSLPYVLRSDAHILATEGIAMLMERPSGSAEWLAKMGVAVRDPAAFNAAGARMRRNKLLIFSRWCQVMLRFERGMYANPDQDLNKLWWDLVEKYQQIKRPAGRNAPDYASKIHVVSAPAYYHNYMMGQLFASQVHAALCRDALDGADPRTALYVGNPAAGRFLVQKVFVPGKTMPWNDLTKFATGEPLNAKAFAADFKK